MTGKSQREPALLQPPSGLDAEWRQLPEEADFGFAAGRNAAMVSLLQELEAALTERLGHDAMEALAAMRHPIAAARVRPCVLLVDDEPLNLDLLADTLKEDCDVLQATAGDMALASAAVDLPDLILLDVMMPGMSGYEVCRRLKANPRTKHIPVIFLTCLKDSFSETTGLVLGAVDYISKPIHPQAVAARVGNQIKLKIANDHLVRLVGIEQALRANLVRKLQAAQGFPN